MTIRLPNQNINAVKLNASMSACLTKKIRSNPAWYRPFAKEVSNWKSFITTKFKEIPLKIRLCSRNWVEGFDLID
jgi:hypothetical protein